MVVKLEKMLTNKNFTRKKVFKKIRILAMRKYEAHLIKRLLEQ
jgi:hypothetical protein